MRGMFLFPTLLELAAAAAVVPTMASAQRYAGYYDADHPRYERDDRREAWVARERWARQARWEREQARRRYWDRERWEQGHYADRGHWDRRREDDDD